MGFLAGKRLLITGLLSNRSIAYGIARACRREGAELALQLRRRTFQDRITEFAAEFDTDLVFDCDVGDDGRSSAFADLPTARTSSTVSCTPSPSPRARPSPADFLDGLTRGNFRIAHDISAYSFRRWPRPRCRGCARARRC